MSTITPEQRREIEQAHGGPIRLTDPQSNDTYYLLSADVFERLRELMEQRREEDALLDRSRKNRLRWIAENPY